MRRFYKWIFWGLIMIGVTSCKTSKQAVDFSGNSLKHVSTSDYFNDLLEHELTYKTLSLKMNLELNSNGKSISSKATLKMEKDKVIQISVQPFLGMEAFRMNITPDSIVVIDRINQRYIAESLSALKKNGEVDFNVIQSLFSNHLFIPNKSKLSASDKSYFKMEKQMGDDKVVLSLKKSEQLSYLFIGNAINRIATTHVDGTKSAKFSMNWNYSNFELFSDVIFPAKMKVDVATKEKKATVTFSISNIEKDAKMNINLSVPTKYSRIGIDGLFNLLTQ